MYFGKENGIIIFSGNDSFIDDLAWDRNFDPEGMED
jgi:hypothetical protein